MRSYAPRLPEEESSPPQSSKPPPNLREVGNETLLASIVESTDDAIISKNLESVILSWNRAAERIFGYTAEEAIGQKIYLIIPREHADEERIILDRLRRGERIDHFETIRRRKDGKLIEVSLTVSPLKNARGEVVGASKIARDITERKRTEEALRLAQIDLQDHARKLEDTVAARTAELRSTIAELEGFSYSLSHDMRAPLRAIHSFSQIVLADAREKLGPEQIVLLERIIKAAGRLDRLIQDVLMYSRVTRETIQLQRVELDALIREIIEERPELQQPQSDVQLAAPIEPICGHEAHVTQVLSNFVEQRCEICGAGR